MEPNIPAPDDIKLGSEGRVSCHYTPGSVPYSSGEWLYKKNKDDPTFERVYYYEATGFNRSYRHLLNRATHIHTNTEMTLVIDNLNETDDGFYRGTLTAGTRPRCVVEFITSSMFLSF